MTTDQKNHYILRVALGPVGGFIGGGRRSRDLWYGSRWVSEVTRQAVRFLHVYFGGNWTSPSGGRLELLVPQWSRIDQSFLKKNRGPVISNQILARLRDANATEIREALTKARQHVRDFVADEIEACANDQNILDIADGYILREQADAIRAGDFLEFYATAEVWNGENDGLDEDAAISRANKHLTGMKTSRDYQIATSEPGRPKSSMDAGWDSALYEDDDDDQFKILEFERARRGVRHEERLDAIGVLRRRAIFEKADASLEPLPFPPLARVTAQPWIDGVTNTAPSLLQRVAIELDRLRQTDVQALLLFATPSREPGKELHQIPTIFGYDPSLLFDGGIVALRRELRRVKEGNRRLQALGGKAQPRNLSRWADIEKHIKKADECLQRLHNDVGRLHDQFGVPEPYYAFIEADGDGVGSLLQNAQGYARDSFIKGLYNFADKAWDTIEENEGTAFYVGGDELAAYLPVDKALIAVRQLMKLFNKTVGEPARLKFPEKVPTLSVGLVVAHVKDDLRSSRRKAAKALKLAKDQRYLDGHGGNYLHVVEAVRGAADRHFSGRVLLQHERTNAQRTDFVDDLAHWQSVLTNDRDVSLNMVHAWMALMERDLGGLALGELVNQDLKARSERDGREVDERLQKRLKECTKDADRCHERLLGLVNEILFASRLVAVTAQRRPQGGR